MNERVEALHRDEEAAYLADDEEGLAMIGAELDEIVPESYSQKEHAE